MAATKPTQFAVIYRMGGTLRAVWIRVADAFTRERAEQECQAIERMGYKALMYPVAVLATMGLPEGWDYATWKAQADQAEQAANPVAVAQAMLEQYGAVQAYKVAVDTVVALQKQYDIEAIGVLLGMGGVRATTKDGHEVALWRGVVGWLDEYILNHAGERQQVAQ